MTDELDMDYIQSEYSAGRFTGPGNVRKLIQECIRLQSQVGKLEATWRDAKTELSLQLQKQEHGCSDTFCRHCDGVEELSSLD